MCQTINERLKKIIEAMTESGISAVVIPTADPHQSEYLPDHWKLREWVSGFTGSAGTIVITKETSGIWTDSRYYLQAEQEIEGTQLTLFRQGQKGIPSPFEYLLQHLDKGSRVSLNPKMWSISQVREYEKHFKEHELVLDLKHSIVENIWNDHDRPQLPSDKIFLHVSEFVSRSVEDKLALVRRQMKDLNVAQHLITSLDDIAWLYNLRGSDIAYNPVFLGYTIIGSSDAHLFVDSTKLTNEVKLSLQNQNIVLHEYGAIEAHLTKVEVPTLINPKDCNYSLYEKIPHQYLVEGPTITRLMKACKTKSDIQHIDQVMIKDGIALVKAFHELQSGMPEKTMTEFEFAQIIARQRSEQPHYYGESFPAIVGYEGNGAIVHYRPSPRNSATIQPKGLLLCDSGGQYYDGTTDITRTIAVGPVTDEQKDRYTRVLKGHIAIDQAVFPKGTTGGQLDILSRQYLWREGIDFGHGTGHGVGFFLNVHEPPQGISPGTSERATTAILPGMLTSNEPGYYKDGEYGIRIENLIIAEESEHEGFVQHRHVSLFPIDTSLIVNNLMTRAEINWVNDYHCLVWKKLAPFLEGAERDWLKNNCRLI